MVNHKPITDVDKVCKVYSEKDGVPIKYVCTTSLSSRGRSFDVFYRETPHPEFGNRYFGLDGKYITNGDKVEELTFDCIEGDTGWEYSSYAHDFKYIGDYFIDGGRDYTRVGGRTIPKVTAFKVKDGEFCPV